jgi:hypothetical protein
VKRSSSLEESANSASFVTQPNMYARGILFGKMKYELGDHSYVRCPELGLMADLDFKTKGYFGGTYDAIGGCIKDTKTDRILFELSGHWNKEMYIKDMAVGTTAPIFTRALELTSYRPERRNYFSTRPMRSTRLRQHDPWKNRASVNHRNSGTE